MQTQASRSGPQRGLYIALSAAVLFALAVTATPQTLAQAPAAQQQMAPPPPQQMPPPCRNCGTIESVVAFTQKGEGTGAGAVVGGVAGAAVGSQIGRGRGSTAATVLGAVGGAVAGHEVEKEVRKTTKYRIVIRMDDASARTVIRSAQPDLRSGDRVQVKRNGVITRF